MQKKTEGLLLRIITFILGLAVIAGSMMTLLIINVSIFGKSIFSQKIGILSLLQKGNKKGVLDQFDSLGLSNINEIDNKLRKVLTLPVGLYLAILLMVIVIMVLALVNKLSRVRVVLSILATVMDVALVILAQEMPGKLVKTLLAGKAPGFLDISNLIGVKVGAGLWIMLAALILLTILSIIQLIPSSEKITNSEGF